VLCVTHLPQLAAYGDTHFAVSKRIVSVDGDERTATDVTSLSGEERIDELVLMLGASSESGRQSISEIMAEAEQFKSGAPAAQRATP
jgi:DNA repair protein RecN (Recombination protein N)